MDARRIVEMSWFQALALFLFLGMTSQLLGSDGDLDMTFGIRGRTTPTLSGHARAVALQPDEKIVVAGWNEPYRASDFAVVRYNGDGSLDPVFGVEGKITTDFGANDQALAVALQPDGKIVVAGLSGSAFALARYNSNGSLDTTFGLQGKTTTAFSSYTEARAVVVQDDGKIVLAGSTGSGSNSDFAVARYNTDGSLDVSFGIAGKVTTDFSSGYDAAYALTLQTDGKIVAAGTGGPEHGVAFARYNPDGSLDPAFGNGGQVTDFDDYWPRGVYAMALQPNGKIVAAAGGLAVEVGLRLLRLNNDGSLDTTFGTKGKVLYGFDPWSLALQADGKIIIGAIPYVSNASLARYESDGSLDASFGTKGYAGNDEGGAALAIQSDGKIIAAGIGFSFALARYNSGLPALRFEGPTMRPGNSFMATFSGTSLNDETYFDLRFRAPGAATDEVALNWQRGRSASHSLPVDVLAGTWTVTGIHPHQNIDEHTPAFVSVAVDLNIGSYF